MVLDRFNGSINVENQTIFLSGLNPAPLGERLVLMVCTIQAVMLLCLMSKLDLAKNGI